jgi:DNA adenine methylase
MRPIIARVGGKTKLADKLIAMFPDHKTYVEPFIGGGSIFMKKEPSEIEVINDKDIDVMNIYRDIRKVDSLSDREFQPNRAKFNRLKNQTKFKNEKERLYRNLYLSLVSFRGDRSNYIGENLESDIRYRNVGRSKWKDQRVYDGFKERLSSPSVKIYSKDYQEIIKKYDAPDTFFYLDPPYSRAVKSKDYKEMGVKIEDICQFLKGIKGKFMMSYDAELDVKRICPKFNIYKTKTKYESSAKGKSPYEVVEFIITNFKL